MKVIKVIQSLLLVLVLIRLLEVTPVLKVRLLGLKGLLERLDWVFGEKYFGALAPASNQKVTYHGLVLCLLDASVSQLRQVLDHLLQAQVLLVVVQL